MSPIIRCRKACLRRKFGLVRGCFQCLAQILSNNSNNIKNNKPLSRLMLNLTKLHLKVSQSLLAQEIWAGAWDSFAFFSGKTDQEMAVFWSKTEILGQFCVFFLKRQLMTNK